jgi:hypothetical protein
MPDSLDGRNVLTWEIVVQTDPVDVPGHILKLASWSIGHLHRDWTGYSVTSAWGCVWGSTRPLNGGPSSSPS